MAQRYSNNAICLLGATLSDSATSLAVETGLGDLFPEAGATTPSGDDWFKVVLTDDTGEIEIIYVYTRATGSDIMADCIRGREGTAARAWASGAVVKLAMTAEDLQQALNNPEWNTIPVMDGTSGRALTADDVGNTVPSTGTVTVPSGVLAKDDIICVYNDSASNIAINRAAGVTMWWVNGINANRTLRPRGLCSIYCIRANEFVITGQGVV